MLMLTLSAILVQFPSPATALPGSAVDSPSNIWSPYGPRSSNLQFNFYSSETAEFTDFELGHLDLTDWPAPSSLYSSWDNNPDFVLSPGQGQYGMFGIDFNYASSTWAAWGCDWQHGNSACGIEMREAFAHLIDRQSFVTDGPLQGAGQGIADPSPPAKDPPGSPLSTQVGWDTLTGQNVSGIVQPQEISAFHVAPSPGGFARPGSPDFCAARSHLIAAGIGLQDNNRDCIIDSSSPGLSKILAHPLRFMIRSDDIFRYGLGLGFSNALNQLFGANVVSPFFGSIVQLRPIVFVSAPDGLTDDWDMYTMGWNLAGPFPDHLRPLYGSLFASNQCGGVLSSTPLDYGFLCVPTFDSYANAAAQTADISLFRSSTLAAFNELGKRVANIPVYARGIRIAELRSMTGAVNMRGQSYPNFWTILNAHNDTSYTPVNPIYKFGGGSNTIRWGQRQGTSQLNPFNYQTFWEGNIVGEIFDTLLAASPIEPANIICWMCNTYEISFDAQGNTQILLDLRNNLRWHDGVPVNASDVKFTLLNMRDVPSALIAGNVQLLMGVTIINSNLVQITMQGQSISHLVNLAGVPIIPMHIWALPGDRTYGCDPITSSSGAASACVGKADPAKTSKSYDMIAAGTLIGSGPFMCRSVFPQDSGKIGTGCSQNAGGLRAGQAIGPGGSIFLQAYDRTKDAGASDPFNQYMRSYNTGWGTGTGISTESGQFQEFSWADRYDNATVNIRDLVNLASCYGKTNSTGCPDYSYWLRPALHPSQPNTISAEVFILEAHIDETYVSPFSWSGNASSQPGLTLENIAPFTP